MAEELRWSWLLAFQGASGHIGPLSCHGCVCGFVSGSPVHHQQGESSIAARASCVFDRFMHSQKSKSEAFCQHTGHVRPSSLVLLVGHRSATEASNENQEVSLLATAVMSCGTHGDLDVDV